jgi:hypothetical protein
LCCSKLGEGGCEVLELVVELFLDLRELRGGEGSKVDWFVFLVSGRDKVDDQLTGLTLRNFRRHFVA